MTLTSRDPARRARPTDRELAELLARQRLADLSWPVLMGALLIAGACALLLGNGAPAAVFVPVLGVSLAVALVATAAWAVGEIRATRAIDRFDNEPRPRPASWKYAVSWGLALTAGAGYWFAPDGVRGLLWKAYVVGACGVALWLSTRQQNSRMRRRRRLKGATGDAPTR